MFLGVPLIWRENVFYMKIKIMDGKRERIIKHGSKALRDFSFFFQPM